MPKAKDAFAFRNFDFEQFVQKCLAKYGLKENALDELDANLNDFFDLRRKDKAYQKLHEELKNFVVIRLKRHYDRLTKYRACLVQDVTKLDDDEYYLSVVRPRDKRISKLAKEYQGIFEKINNVLNKIETIGRNLKKYQNNFYLKIFAARLRKARETAGLTQVQLADILGIKRSSYNAYETARNEPNISVLALVSKELNRPVNWFLGL